MNEPLHPHWHATDDEQPVPVRSSTPASVPHIAPTSKRISRKPAAYTGIALFLVVGVGLAGGFRGLLGQAGPSDVRIELTAEGPIPASVSAAPGQVITWVNADSIPHIITMETLLDEQGAPYESAAMFPGDEVSFAIPIDTAVGSYTYGSTTSPDFSGEIYVDSSIATSTDAPDSTNDPMAYEQMPYEQMEPVPSDSITEQPIMAEPMPSATSPVVQANTLPPVPSYAAETIPAASTTTLPSNPYANNPTETLHSGADPNLYKPVVTGHKPVSQPSSGPSLWIAILASTAAFSLWARRALRA